jgi:hypothetical protein
MKKRMFLGMMAMVICVPNLQNGNQGEARAEDVQRGNNALSPRTRGILEGSEKFVLISLEPTWLTPEEKKNDKRQTFHRRPMLGQTEIKDPELKRKLVAALYAAADEYRKPGVDWAIPGCFNPRHGIKATAGTNWVELVICFQCVQVVEYRNDGEDWTMLSKEPTALFNQTLAEAGVPLAK